MITASDYSKLHLHHHENLGIDNDYINHIVETMAGGGLDRECPGDYDRRLSETRYF